MLDAKGTKKCFTAKALGHLQSSETSWTWEVPVPHSLVPFLVPECLGLGLLVEPVIGPVHIHCVPGWARRDSTGTTNPTLLRADGTLRPERAKGELVSKWLRHSTFLSL